MFQKRYFSFLILAASLPGTYTAKGQSTDWTSIATERVKLDTAFTHCMYVADINNDHYPDIITVKNDGAITAADNLKVYMNIQDITSSDPRDRIFVDVTETTGINAMQHPDSISRGTTVAALADVNNDGNIDIVRGNYYHTSLSTYTDRGDRCEVLLGDGQGHFTIVPHNGLRDLGLINPTGFSFLDYDKDGKIDLFIAVWFADYTVFPETLRSGFLMKGNGDGTFTNVSAAAGINKPEAMYGACVVDWNNDGWPDIATDPYCRTGGQLWKNKGDGTFEDVAASANYNARFMQGDNGQNLCLWASIPEDFDNDGDMDFFYALVHGGNDPGEGHSTVVVNGGAADNYRLSWALDRITWKIPKSAHHGDYDASWFDLDNDGLEDIVMTQGHYAPATDRLYVFRQGQDHRFEDVTQQIGLLTAATKDNHMVEVLDYDLDGDDDIIFSNLNQNVARKLRFVKNEIGQDNNWTAIRLSAPDGVNKSCIGARIAVWSGGVKRMREVYAGRGNAAGQQPFAMIFGLGSNTVIDSVKVYWPHAGNRVTTVKRPPVNQYLDININGVGVRDPENAAAGIYLKVYPNPARDFILVQLSDNTVNATVEVYNMNGQKMQQATVYNNGSATRYCSVRALPAGSYIVKAVTEKGNVFTRVFVKEE